MSVPDLRRALVRFQIERGGRLETLRQVYFFLSLLRHQAMISSVAVICFRMEPVADSLAAGVSRWGSAAGGEATAAGCSDDTGGAAAGLAGAAGAAAGAPPGRV